jgi:sodium-dependent dicarboxylate transporter 2/3/5
MAHDSHSGETSGLSWYRVAGLLGGPLLAGGMLLAPAPDGLSADGWSIAAVGVLMAVWWTTEAVPLAATALLPLLLFPVLGLRDLAATAPAYANPLIFLFLGGFLLARGMQVWGVDRRLAVAVLRRSGSDPRLIIAAVMTVTAFLSMWASNTATAMVMLPIGQSIVAASDRAARGACRDFAPALMLAIAYAATIGGMGTLIGTPPNALFAAFMETRYGVEIGFARWLLVGVPLLLVLLPVAWLVLTRLAFRIPAGGSERGFAGIDVADAEVDAVVRRGGQIVAAAMGLAALGWLSRPLLERWFPDLLLSDAGIAMACALMLFVLPVDPARGRFALSWREAAAIRWDVLILFGGGLALAAAIGDSDLADWLGGRFAALDTLPLIVLLAVIGAIVVLVGELASNTAMAAVFLPVAGATAVAMGEPALSLALPLALFATLGFMLPVATPPNAIVFGSEQVGAGQMLRAGAILDVAGIVVVIAIVLTVGRWAFGSP